VERDEEVTRFCAPRLGDAYSVPERAQDSLPTQCSDSIAQARTSWCRCDDENPHAPYPRSALGDPEAEACNPQKGCCELRRDMLDHRSTGPWSHQASGHVLTRHDNEATRAPAWVRIVRVFSVESKESRASVQLTQLG
jgi:hypothetical protein